MVLSTTIPFSSPPTSPSVMISISLSIFPLLFFLLLVVDRGVAGPTLDANLLLPQRLSPPKPDCSSACQLAALPDESGRSSFSQLCEVAVPDKACTKSGQLETDVSISGSDTQDIFIKCLCNPNGHGVEISRSEGLVKGISSLRQAEFEPQ